MSATQNNAPTLDELRFAWQDNWTMNIIKVVILSIVLLTTLVFALSASNLQEIIKNWSRYRCNPAFMPFAGAVGYDATDNFKFCLNATFGDKIQEVFKPIFGLLSNFVQIIKMIVDVSLGLRQLFGNFLLSVNSFIRNVRDRIQGLLFQVRMSFIRIQNLMGRVYASLFAVIFMGMSAITAGMNLSENSLVEFILEFCFDPETLVRMEDGTLKTIKNVQIGDRLQQGGRVTSVFHLKGDGTPMVQIGENGVILSSQHLVQIPSGDWGFAKDHPAATTVPNIPLLICLNTENHVFETVGADGKTLLVRDYDETEDAAVIQSAQQIASKALNGSVGSSGTTAEYRLGISPDAEVELVDGSWMPLREIPLCTVLAGGNTVVGLVDEECPTVCRVGDLTLSSAQLIHVGTSWIRAGTLHATSSPSDAPILKQIISREMRPIHVRMGNMNVWIRDYREVPLAEMEDPYLQVLKIDQ